MLNNKNNRHSIIYIAENPIDVRMVRGFTHYYALTLLGRRNAGEDYINWACETPDDFSLLYLAHNRLLFALSVFFFLIRYSKKYSAVIVVDNLLGAIAANLAKFITSKPVVIQVGRTPDEYYRCKYTKKEINFVTYLIGYLFLKFLIMLNSYIADCNLVVTKYNYKAIERYSRNSEIIPWYGVDVSIYKPSSESLKKKFREELRLPLNSFIVFYPSRISAEKDPDTLLKAIKELQESGQDIIALNLSGQFKMFELLAKKYNVKVIARLPVNPTVDLPKYYQASDLFVQTSLAEGIGISHLEALACGLPVIVSDVGGLTDLMKDKIYGRIVPSQDVKTLKELVIFAIENNELMKKWALSARGKIEEVYSEEYAFNSINKIIQKIGV